MSKDLKPSSVTFFLNFVKLTMTENGMRTQEFLSKANSAQSLTSEAVFVLIVRHSLSP